MTANKNKYAISIILPCYNVAQYIERAIKSILIQNFSSYEIIIINDGSTDNLIEICESIIQRCKKDNIRLLSFENQGISQARNEGLKVAQGEYIYFCDPDDYINPETLSAIYTKAKEEDYDAVHFGFQMIYEDQNGRHCDEVEESHIYRSNKEIINQYLPKFLGVSQQDIDEWINMSSMWNKKEFSSVWRFLYKRSVLINNSIYFPKDIKLSEDKFFNVHFFCYAQTIAIMDKVFYNYIIKNKGLLLSSLNNAQSLVDDKINGVEQRALLRDLFLKEKEIDIFPYYIGSIVFGALELIMRFSNTPLRMSIKGLNRYLKLPDVKRGITEIRTTHLPFKLKLSIYLLKIGLHNILLLGVRIMAKMGVKANI